MANEKISDVQISKDNINAETTMAEETYEVFETS